MPLQSLWFKEVRWSFRGEIDCSLHFLIQSSSPSYLQLLSTWNGVSVIERLDFKFYLIILTLNFSNHTWLVGPAWDSPASAQAVPHTSICIHSFYKYGALIICQALFLVLEYMAVNNKNKTKQNICFIELCSMLTVKHSVKEFGDAVLSIVPLSIESWTLELTQRITAKA